MSEIEATLAEAKARIEAAIRAHAPAARVSGLARLTGGACQDNLRVDLDGHDTARLVVRSDAPRSLPGSLDRSAELAVIQAAVDAGVRTPVARWLTPDLLRPGAAAYFLDWAEGIALGGKVVRDPRLEGARQGLGRDLAEQLARIHAITPATHPELLGPAPEDPIEHAVGHLRTMLEALPRPRPALELACLWLRDHRPPTTPTTLVHGDYRTGNFLVAPSGLSAILDWEFAHWGNPDEDLAWIAVRDWRFGRLDLPIGGVCAREPFYAAYAEASGRDLDPASLRWWEVLGNVRWGAACVYQGERYLSGEQPDLEFLAIARRAGEMEFEALRLIEEPR
jgi:aminoglycoside phosphotransferase (APT) family kinase protein